MQLVDKVTLGDTSTEAASIASFRGRLFIAWKGVGNNELNVIVLDRSRAHLRQQIHFAGNQHLHARALRTR